MVHPVLTLLVAGSIQFSSEAPRRADLAQFVIEMAQVIDISCARIVPPALEPTVCDVPFYYDDLAAVPTPPAEPILTYDWRSPVIFDLP